MLESVVVFGEVDGGGEAEPLELILDSELQLAERFEQFMLNASVTEDLR